MIKGRPRHPQSQGCVEQGNGVKQILSSFTAESENNEWVKYIPKVQCKLLCHCIVKIIMVMHTHMHCFYIYIFTVAMNIQFHETIKAIPYEVVFGVSASSEPVSNLQIVDGEGLAKSS